MEMRRPGTEGEAISSEPPRLGPGAVDPEPATNRSVTGLKTAVHDQGRGAARALPAHRVAFGRLLSLGFSQSEAASLTAATLGLRPASGWSLAEIDRLLFVRWVAARDRSGRRAGQGDTRSRGPEQA